MKNEIISTLYIFMKLKASESFKKGDFENYLNYLVRAEDIRQSFTDR